MFPLTIKDLPVEAWDVIDALGLVPVKMTNDNAPELYWSVFADADCLQDASIRDLLGISFDEMEFYGDFVQLPYELSFLSSDSKSLVYEQLSFDFSYDTL